MALKNLKSLFIVEDEEDTNNKSETKKDQEKKVVDKKTTDKEGEKKDEKADEKSQISWKSSHGTSDISDNTELQGAFNQQIFDSLTKAVANANLPGEDYIEFIQSLKAMKDLPLEESVKMQTVLATLSTKGLTKQKIFESADYYINVLEEEKKKFYTALEGQAKGNINKKKQTIENLEKVNKEKADQIALLTDEINKNQQQITQISKDISQSESKIKSTENNFITTFNKVLKQITGNIEKIKNLNN